MAQKAHPRKKAAKKGHPKPKPAKAKRPKPKATQKARPKPTADVTQTDVCSDNWSGSANEDFEWVNGTSAAVDIKQDGSNTWPFQNFASGSSVPVGTQSCQLIGTKGTYTYKVEGGCPQLGNPKTVIIT